MIRAMILRAAGTNCDHECAHAWELAGVAAERVHIRRLIDEPRLLDDFQILTIPGGFSYGDDIAAGAVFAHQLRRSLFDRIRDFASRDRLVLGVCNGFQILVKAGLLPNPGDANGRAMCTVTYNEPRGFQDRWVTLRGGDSPCAFLERGRVYEMPIAHGEGRVAFASEADLRAVQQAKQDALLYVGGDAASGQGGGPANPNGSTADIAGLCDPTGRIFGLMPHPDRFTDWTQHPCWTSLPARECGDGLHLFRRAAARFR